MFQEFKEFLTRGNVIDLAVGIIMGAAFTAIVSSLVSDIIMPPVGMVLGGVDFSDFFFSLDGKHYASMAEAKAAHAATLNYGVFINAIIKFLVVGFSVFLLVKQANKLQAKLNLKKQEAPKVTPDQALLMEIRDLLKTQNQKI